MNVLQNAVIHAELDLNNCTGELLLNGIPIMSCKKPEPFYSQSFQVNPSLVPGLNTLELAVDIDTSAPSLCRRRRQSKLPPNAAGKARLVRYPLTPKTFTAPEFGQVLASVSWSAAADEFAESPKELHTQVHLDVPFSRRAFQDAEPLTLDAGLRDAAIYLLEYLQNAMRRGDADTIFQMLSIRMREGFASYDPPLDEAQMRAEFASWLKPFVAEPERVAALDPSKLDFRLAASNRLLIPMRKDWQTAITVWLPMNDMDGQLVGDIELPYPVRLGRVQGSLVVLG